MAYLNQLDETDKQGVLTVRGISRTPEENFRSLEGSVTPVHMDLDSWWEEERDGVIGSLPPEPCLATRAVHFQGRELELYALPVLIGA